MKAKLIFTLYTGNQTFEDCYVPIKGVVGGNVPAGDIEVYPAVGVPESYKAIAGQVANTYYRKGIQVIGGVFGLQPNMMSNNFIGFTWETEIDV